MCNIRAILFFIALLSYASVSFSQDNQRQSAIAWLLINQNTDGSWGVEGNKVVATAEKTLENC